MATPDSVDLFLSYNRSDLPAVLTVKAHLEERGLRTFFDQRDLVAGLPWPQALEQRLLASRAVAVFLGPGGFGRWQEREMYFALDLQQTGSQDGHRRPVVPVLLPGAELSAGFLFLNTWIDLRQDPTDPASLDALTRAVAPAAEEEGGRPTVVTLCPYRGLRAFREEDAAFYCGREAFVEELTAKTLTAARTIGTPSLVALVGPSGSGKSSVVLAGLIPRLRRRRPPELIWDVTWQVPGQNPWRRLADALIPLLDPDLSETGRIAEANTLAAALAAQVDALPSTIHRILEKSGGTDRLLLVIDQFEELFRLTPEPDRGPFLRALLLAASVSPLTVVLTLRSDFYGLALDSDRDLSDALGRGQVNLGPMRSEELRRTIEEPARRVGLALDPGLTDLILEDVAAEPGRLPLLEYALTELWQRRQGNRLTLDGYLKTGRVAEAVATRAEAVFTGLSRKDQEIARGLFTRLVHATGEGEEGNDTRRRAKRPELGEEAWSVAQVFAGEQARLLVSSLDPDTGDETLELAHEALLRSWRRLRDWITEDRTFLVWRQQLAAYLSIWEDSGRDREGLLRGPMLVTGRRWLGEKILLLNKSEKEFLQRSQRGAQRRRSLLRFAAILAMMILAAGSGWFGYTRTDRYQINSILAENAGNRKLAESDSAPAYLASLTFLNRRDEAKTLALVARNEEDKVRNLTSIAAALSRLGNDADTRALMESAERIVVGSEVRGLSRMVEANPTMPLSSYIRSSLVAIEPAKRIALLAHLLGVVSKAGNLATARELIVLAERTADTEASQLLKNCGPVSLGILDLAAAGEKRLALKVFEITHCDSSDPLFLSMLGQREKAQEIIRGWPDYDLYRTVQVVQVYLNLNDAQSAREALRGLDYSHMQNIRSIVLSAEGKFEAAERLIDDSDDFFTTEIVHQRIVHDLVKANRVEEASSFKHTSEKLKSEFYWLLALELFQAGDWERAGDAALKSGRPNMFSLLADSSEKLALSDKKRHVVEATLSLLQAEAAKDKGGRHRDEDILRWQQTQGTHLAICRVLAYLHRYREARLWADTQLSALDRIDAHTAILSAYAREKNPQLVDFIFPRKPYSYMSD